MFPVEREYANPNVSVAMEGIGTRLCVDYRVLNSMAVSDAFPTKKITKLMYEVSQANYIRVVDNLRGYWQTHMDSPAQGYTAFVTNQE